MASVSSGSYQHTQRAPLCLLLYVVAAQFVVTAWLTRAVYFLPILFAVLSVVMLGIAMSFHYLRVSLEADRVKIGFGPLPLFTKTVRYEDIVSAEVSRTTILDGWGIHYSLSGAWVWNLWGFECVRLQLVKGGLCIGTNDAAQLAAALQQHIQNRPAKDS